MRPSCQAARVPIEIALLGCAHPHLPDLLGVLASEPDLRLAAAWDPDPAAVPPAIGGAAVTRARTAIGRADAVVIAAPVDERPGLCVEAARAGRPILVEQPIALSAGEAARLAREIGRSRTPAVGAFFLRELPALARLAGVLRERLLGRLAGVTATWVHAGALDGWFNGPRAWMRDPARAGVGGFGDRSLHLLDALSVLPAEAPPALAAVVLDRDGPGDVGGQAVGTWGSVPLGLQAGWAARPAGLELVVRGTAGTATLRDGVLELTSGSGAPQRWVGPPPDAGEALRAFAARLRSRRLARDGLAPAVRAHAVLEAAVAVA
jgi:predicted dehydrogenase